MKTSRVVTILSLFLFLAGCGPVGMFYYPNKHLYLDPEKLNMPYDMMQFDSANGKKLFGILFKTSQPPKGIVVHFHGNFGNVSNHFLGAHFLVDYGFDVLAFDYQGYGGSEGKPTPKRCIEDGVAAVRFAETLDRNPQGGVVLLGQSLGGAVALPVMAQMPEVRAAVIESAFPSYRGIARDVLKRSAWTWILYPIYPLFLPTKYDAFRYLEKIPPRPLFFIHGDADRTVPYKMSQILYDKASEPKTLWIIPGAGHIGGRQKEGKTFETRVANFFTDALQKSTNTK